jgi:hypothetical protein
MNSTNGKHNTTHITFDGFNCTKRSSSAEKGGKSCPQETT